MEARPLGTTGIAVSRVILGCGNFGGIGSAPEFWGRGESREEAFRIMDAAWELGITTFDTADAYGGGRSETWVGEWLAAKPPEVRERIVVATKTFNPMEPERDRGLGRARILRQAERSLERLGLERLPLYLAHDWDAETPVEETLRAFDELVGAGKVGAVGASNVTGEQLAEAVELSELEGLARYGWVQNAYSLLERADEQAVLPVCREHALGYTPFSPLAGGWLTGKYRRDQAPPAGSRMTLRPGPYARFDDERVYASIDALAAEARDRGVSTAALALAWLLAHPDVTAIVVGPRTPEHLDPALQALELGLTPDDRERIGGFFLAAA